MHFSRFNSFPQSLTPLSLSFIPLAPYFCLAFISLSVPNTFLDLIQFLSPLHLSRFHFIPRSLTPLPLSFRVSVPYTSLAIIHSRSPLHLSRSHSVPQSVTPLSLSFSSSVPYISPALIHSLRPLHLSCSHLFPQSVTPLPVSFSPSVPYTSLALFQSLSPLHLCRSHSVPDIYIFRSLCLCLSLSHSHIHCTKSIQIPNVSRKAAKYNIEDKLLFSQSVIQSGRQSVIQSTQPLAMNHLNALPVQPLGSNEHCILHKVCDGDIVVTACTLRSLITSC